MNPMRFPEALSITLLALCLPITAMTQERALGAAPDTRSGDIRAELGECPTDLLRRAWTEMLPLQSAAVEDEVVDWCTGRTEEIARYIQAETRFKGTLDELTAPVALPDTPPDPAPADRVDLLSAEISELRSRIARLEGQPETPETEETLDRLYADLATKEAELAKAETGLARAQEQLVAEQAPEQTGPVSSDAVEQAVKDPVEEVQTATEAEQPPGVDRLVIPSPGAGSPPMAPPREVTLPPDRKTEWQVIHAVRKGDEPWTVQFQGSREIAISGTGPTPEDPPSIRWQVVTDPPVTVTVGETLPDGMILKDVTKAGVHLAPAKDLIGALSPLAAQDAEPLLIPFISDPAPGTLQWDVRKHKEESS